MPIANFLCILGLIAVIVIGFFIIRKLRKTHKVADDNFSGFVKFLIAEDVENGIKLGKIDKTKLESDIFICIKNNATARQFVEDWYSLNAVRTMSKLSDEMYAKFVEDIAKRYAK